MSSERTDNWPGWIVGRTQLSYRIGEVLLFKSSWPSLSRIIYIDDCEPDVRPSLPGGDAIPQGFRLVVVRSQPIRKPLAWLHRYNGHYCYVPRQGARYYIALRGTFEDYLAKFSSKTRATLKRKVRKFAEAGGGVIDFRAYRTAAELREFHPAARVLASSTYQERLFDNALPADNAFVSEMLRRAASDTARAFLLFLHGQPIAYLYCPIMGTGSVIYEFVGFAPQHADLSPGTVLQFLALESLFEEGRFTSFDFTEGEGVHKQFFATDSIVCADTYYFKSIGILAAVYAHHAIDQCSRLAGRLLDRFGLKTKIKRMIRKL